MDFGSKCSRENVAWMVFRNSCNLNGTDVHPCSDISSSVAIRQVSLAIDLASAIELRVTSNGYRNGGADDGARR